MPRPRAKIPWYQSLGYWVGTLLLGIIGGPVAYFREQTDRKKAFAIGAAAPGIVLGVIRGLRSDTISAFPTVTRGRSVERDRRFSGRRGLTAGLKDQNRHAVGHIPGALGLFAAFTHCISTQQSGRFASRNCQLILDFNPKDTALKRAAGKLSSTPFVLDSLKHARDSVRAAFKRSKHRT